MILTLWLLAVAVSAWQYRVLAGGSLSPTRLNYFSLLFWLGLMVFTMPGALLVATGRADDLFFIQPIAHDAQAKTMAFQMICWSAVATPAFSLLTFTLFRQTPRKVWERYLNRPLDTDSETGASSWLWVLGFMLTIYILLFLVVQVSTHPSPLYLSFTGAGELEIAQRRIEVTRMYQGAKPIKSFLNLLGPVILYACVAHGYSAGRKQRSAKILALITGLLVAVSTLTDSEKAPVIFVVLGIILTLIYVGRRPSGKALLVVAAIILGLVVLSYALFFSDVVEGGWLLERLSERIFVAQMAAVPLCAAEYPRYSPFIGLDSLDSILNKPLGLVPVARASEWLMIKYFPDLAISGGWNVNGFFIHEAWANFGPGGLVLGPGLVGAVHSGSVILFERIRKNPVMVGLFAYFSADITLFITGFNRYLFNTGLAHILLLMVGTQLLHTAVRRFRIHSKAQREAA